MATFEGQTMYNFFMLKTLTIFLNRGNGMLNWSDKTAAVLIYIYRTSLHELPLVEEIQYCWKCLFCSHSVTFGAATCSHVVKYLQSSYKATQLQSSTT